MRENKGNHLARMVSRGNQWKICLEALLESKETLQEMYKKGDT